MGKRRLRFDQRKNYERKKRRMSVNTPPDLSTQQELVVSLPLSAYMSTATTDVSTLFSRLRSMNSLPASWSIADAQQVPSPHQTINLPLTLCKMQCHPPDYVPTLVFTVAFDDQCTWTLRVYGSHVIVQRCTLLSDVEPSLRSVDSVVGFLSILDSSKFCEGNSDAKFRDLAKYSRGVFKDQHSNLVIIMVVHFTCQLNLFMCLLIQEPMQQPSLMKELSHSPPFDIVSVPSCFQRRIQFAADGVMFTVELSVL